MNTPPSSSPRGYAWPSMGVPAAQRGMAKDKRAPKQAPPLVLDSADRSAICTRYIDRLNKLQGLLVQDSSIVMERMLKLPHSKREGMARQLGKRHILQTLLQPRGGQPGAWKALAGLDEDFDRLSEDKQASRLIWREMEVFVKSATDLTKTEAEYNLLIQRVWEYKTALGMEELQHESTQNDPRARASAVLEHFPPAPRSAPLASRKHPGA